ncbi:class I SAM-dependent methyltransferase [Halobaculum sp. MBLA0147]|uniref:class I SAM-dependent methyltransferase n=1 Tax=Halobaculum sp. MBLA0147 TaxID=3079934 RepID=UPI003525C5D5
MADDEHAQTADRDDGRSETADRDDERSETAESDHDHGDVRYLDAKATVDDRARDRRVRETLLDALPDRPRVFDAGCGTGVALDRLRSWGVRPAAYHGVDADPSLVATARERHEAESEEDVTFAVGDAVAAAREWTGPPPELVVAQSFLDLVAPAEALDAFAGLLAPGGFVYAPFTFDGTTGFAPAHPVDDLVAELYHAGIDAEPGRNNRAGRAALSHLRERPGETLAVAGSDWIVRPRGGGSAGSDAYPADEWYFLDRILGFVADTLLASDVRQLSELSEAALRAADLAPDAQAALDAARDAGDHESDPTGDPESDPTGDHESGLTALHDWLVTRRRQSVGGTLTYVAHQVDICHRTPE